MKLPRGWILGAAAAALLIGALVAVLVVRAGVGRLERFDEDVARRLSERSLPHPTPIHARPLVVEPGDRPSRLGLSEHLERVGYRKVVGDTVRPGEFSVGEKRWIVGLRAFRFADGLEPGGEVTLELGRRSRIERILDSEGKELGRVRVEPPSLGFVYDDDPRLREVVTLDRVPDHLVEAFLAIEDRRFFDHHGVDPRRILGALVANLRAGRIVQGGSTITQQYVKNALLGGERVLSRKLEEAAISLVLERRHEKEEILEAYLNEIYLGQQGPVAVHGVAAASRHWFGKDVGDLEPHESALLAGLARGPSRYSPRRDPAAAKARRNLVLGAMLEEGYLDEAAYQLAAAAPNGVVQKPELLNSARYFVDTVSEELRERHSSELLATDGLRVFTTLDWRLQRLAEQAVAEGLVGLEKEWSWLGKHDPPLEAALVALDPATGDVLAMVGGRDYGRSQFNRTYQAHRQPGSAFKPVVALAALTPPEPPFTLASVLSDEPIIVPAPDPEPGEEQEEDWIPLNHDEEFRGEVTLRRALEESLNIPIVNLGEEIGLRQVIRTARQLGIRSRLRPVPSLALGTFEMTLLELTQAYAVFAAEGMSVVPRTVKSVQTGEGEVLEKSEPEPKRAFDPEGVFLVTSALEGAVQRGTGKRVRALGYQQPLAGKTGSSDDYRDGWFVGYTPEIVVGVWAGYDDETSTHRPGAFTALPIFTRFAMSALGRSGGPRFEAPPGVEKVRVVASADHRSGLRCWGDPEWFVAETTPTDSCGFWQRLPGVGAPPRDNQDPQGKQPWWRLGSGSP